MPGKGKIQWIHRNIAVYRRPVKIEIEYGPIPPANDNASHASSEHAPKTGHNADLDGKEPGVLRLEGPAGRVIFNKLAITAMEAFIEDIDKPFRDCFDYMRDSLRFEGTIIGKPAISHIKKHLSEHAQAFSFRKVAEEMSEDFGIAFLMLSPSMASWKKSTNAKDPNKFLQHAPAVLYSVYMDLRAEQQAVELFTRTMQKVFNISPLLPLSPDYDWDGFPANTPVEYRILGHLLDIQAAHEPLWKALKVIFDRREIVLQLPLLRVLEAAPPRLEISSVQGIEDFVKVVAVAGRRNIMRSGYWSQKDDGL